MKTKALFMPSVTTLVLGMVVAVAAFASLAMFAHADVAPSVATLTYNSSNALVTSANIGTNVYATAQIGSSSTSTLPTGTVTFNRYAGLSCSGTATTQSGVVLVSGAATSSQVAMTSGGLSYTVSYSGDSFNASVVGPCVNITSTSNAPTLTTTLSNTSVLAGSSVNETATLAGATATAGGSVAYTVYSNNSCTTLWGNAGSKTVTNMLVPASDPFSFPLAGTYYWQGVYSGDASNAAATSSCSALTVQATTTTPVVTASSTISGRVYNDANQNDTLDASEAGIAGFTINLYKGAGWWGKLGLNNPIQTVLTDANGNYSFSNLANGTYSVEEIKLAGWNQTSSDFKSLTIVNGVALTGINFANVAKATTTVGGGNGNHGNGNDGDNDNDDNGSTTSNGNHGNGNNGNHFGWFNFSGWGKGK